MVSVKGLAMTVIIASPRSVIPRVGVTASPRAVIPRSVATWESHFSIMKRNTAAVAIATAAVSIFKAVKNNLLLFL